MQFSAKTTTKKKKNADFNRTTQDINVFSGQAPFFVLVEETRDDSMTQENQDAQKSAIVGYKKV